MRQIYNLAIIFYGAIIYLATPFNLKAKLFVKGRKGWEGKLKKNIKPGFKYIWFHCASLGEFEQGRPVIEDVKNQFPEFKILLTFFSPSGYEIRKNYQGVDYVCYLPLDTQKNAKTFFDIARPEKIFFIKYEYWYNFINEAQNRKIPLYIISAIFRKSQIFFKNSIPGKWYRKTLNGVTHFFVQNIESEKLLKEIGIPRVNISGDTRFDRVAALAQSAKEIPFIEKFKSGKPLLIIGSSWLPDEDLVIKFINQSENIKFIIAPHEVNSSNIRRIKEARKKPVNSFSEIEKSEITNLDVIIIDSIGILSSLYRYGDIAYIGGGFGVGIHNILEAATFGLPVIFGPNYKKFNEAVELKKIGTAFPVTSYEELEQILIMLISNPENLCELSELSKNFVEHNKGATQFIIKNTFSH